MSEQLALILALAVGPLAMASCVSEGGACETGIWSACEITHPKDQEQFKECVDNGNEQCISNLELCIQQCEQTHGSCIAGIPAKCQLAYNKKACEDDLQADCAQQMGECKGAEQGSARKNTVGANVTDDVCSNIAGSYSGPGKSDDPRTGICTWNLQGTLAGGGAFLLKMSLRSCSCEHAHCDGGIGFQMTGQCSGGSVSGSSDWGGVSTCNGVFAGTEFAGTCKGPGDFPALMFDFTKQTDANKGEMDAISGNVSKPSLFHSSAVYSCGGSGGTCSGSCFSGTCKAIGKGCGCSGLVLETEHQADSTVPKERAIVV